MSNLAGPLHRTVLVALVVAGLMAIAGPLAAHAQSVAQYASGWTASVPDWTTHVLAEFVAPDTFAPSHEQIVVEFHSRDPVEPIWQILVPAGCLVPSERRREDFRLKDPAGCGASVGQVLIDGTVHDLGRFINAFEAKLTLSPDDDHRWILRLELVLADPPPDAFPPDPIGGSARFQIGAVSSLIPNSVVESAGAMRSDSGGTGP